MGPLAGLRVLEFEAIGPGAVRRDDAGRHGRRRAARRSRDRCARLGFGRERWYDVDDARPALGRRSTSSRRGGVEAALRLCRTRRRRDRGLPPRRDGAPRARARRVLRAQPAARLRPHDRLGPGRPARRARRPRHQLHRAVGRAARDRPRRTSRRCRRSTWSATSAAAACCSRSASPARVIEAREVRARPGRRCGDGRRRRAAGDDVHRHARGRRAGAKSAASTCSTAARRGTTPTRRRTASTSRSARSSRSSTRELLERLGLADDARCRAQHDRAGWPRAARGASPHAFATRDARRMVRGVRRLRRLLRAGADVLGSARASARAARAARSRRSAAIEQPAPAPRFERTPGGTRRPPPERGELGREALHDWGFDAAQIEQLAALGVGMAAAGAPSRHAAT